MIVAHIAPDLFGNKVFGTIFEGLAKYIEKQLVFVPTKYADTKHEKIVHNDKVEEICLGCYGFFDRVLFFPKRDKTINSIIEYGSIDSVDLIHAHMLVSSGSVAYEIYRKYKVPYVVSVRGSDVYLFWKYFFFLRPMIVRILVNARYIVFLSPGLKEKILEALPRELRKRIEEKSSIVPNGISRTWFLESKKKKLDDSFKILFIGELNKNKNILTVIKSVRMLRQKGVNAILIIVGAGPLQSRIEKIANTETWIKFLGYVNKKSDIERIYEESNTLVVPSKVETFGMVYAEAMSKGLPVVYSKKQGISGFFEEGSSGFAVDPNSAKSIVEALLLIMARYSNMSEMAKKNSNHFSLDVVLGQYFRIYQKVTVHE